MNQQLSKKNMTQPKLPGGWEELTWEQLVVVHRMLAEHRENRAVRNLEVYLYLTGLEIAEGEGEVNDGEKFYYLRQVKSEKRKVKNGLSHGLYTIRDAIRKVFFAIRYSLFTSRNDEEFFRVKADDLSLYLGGCHLNIEDNDETSNKVDDKILRKVERHGALDWLDLPVGKDGKGGLTKLPIESLKIHGRTFELPSSLITNITYEAYGNLQKIQQAVWSLMEHLQNLQNYLSNVDNEEIEQAKPIMQEIHETTQSVQKLRAQYLSHSLLERKKNRHGVTTSEYNSTEAESNVSFITKWAPEWLFDILVQQLQSCLGVYKGQFPELFSKDGGGGRDVIPLVAEVDTINAIQKWQGYQEQQKVYDTNAVFVFSILNSMTKEAKAIEDANAKMKSKSHR